MEETYYKLLNDILEGYDRCTPINISHLRMNQIFVFGTDSKGSQRFGAAGLAAKCFGAQIGVVEGPTGMCYALPSMGFTEQELANAVMRFENFVRINKNYTYLVTAVGCGHAGFDVKQVADMFRGMLCLNNVMLPASFLKVYRDECCQYYNKYAAQSNPTEDEKDPKTVILDYYDKRVHNVVSYLIDNDISFNKDGGYTLVDDEDCVIAEAELGIESEKVVFYPFNSQSEKAFINNGYVVTTPEEYLSQKKR